jgi:hypothetical protein
MSSAIRIVKEPTSVRKQFAVHAYNGIPTSPGDYFFTVQDNKLYRIENDLSGCHWIPARDMGTERTITDIDIELKEIWQSQNGWVNVRVIRPGTAHKFQALAMVKGNTAPSYDDSPAWNAGAYLPYEYKNATPVYNAQTNPINDMLVLGNADTTVSNDYNQNLAYATFWAVNDPVVIEYEFSDVTYRRAIKNRIDATSI